MQLTEHTTSPIDDIIASEGGYVYHPADRGGPTNYGITLQTLRDWRRDRSLGADAVQALTKDEARAIYEEQYVKAPGFDRIECEYVSWQLIDCGIHSGPNRATHWLQEAINLTYDEEGITPLIAVDGIIGPQTMRAVEEIDTEHLNRSLNNHIMAIRLRFLARLAQDDANAVRYGRKSADESRALFISGWTERALRWMV